MKRHAFFWGLGYLFMSIIVMALLLNGYKGSLTDFKELTEFFAGGKEYTSHESEGLFMLGIGVPTIFSAAFGWAFREVVDISKGNGDSYSSLRKETMGGFLVFLIMAAVPLIFYYGFAIQLKDNLIIVLINSIPVLFLLIVSLFPLIYYHTGLKVCKSCKTLVSGTQTKENVKSYNQWITERNKRKVGEIRSGTDKVDIYGTETSHHWDKVTITSWNDYYCCPICGYHWTIKRTSSKTHRYF